MSEKETSSTGVSIVRPSSRRKFLVGMLGGGAILAAGTPGLLQLAQSVRVAWNTKPYPYNLFNNNGDLIGESYSPDLNFMAMIKVHDDGPDAQLSIWDYQQQRMTTLPTGSESGTSSWGPDNKHLLFQSQTSLDLWDVQARQQLASYGGEDYQGFAGLSWSPDGSRVVQFANNDGNGNNNVLVIMSVHPLKLLDKFTAPDSTSAFTWSSDGRRFAFLQSTSSSTRWNILIWDIQSHQVEATVPFQGSYPSGLAWSPDGKRIALFASDHIQIVEMGNTPTSYALNEPNRNGKLVWSPDSRHLAVAVELPSSDRFESTGKFGVWDVIEQKYVRLLRYSTLFGVPDALYWTPDGTTIRAIVDVYQQANWSWP